MTTLADELERLNKDAAACDRDDWMARALKENILALALRNNLDAIIEALRAQELGKP